jgi:hypothetical protein
MRLHWHACVTRWTLINSAVALDACER